MKYQQIGKFVVAVFVGFGLLACGPTEPILDASNIEAYEKSVSQIVQSLPEDQKQIFPIALLSLTISRADEEAGPLAGLMLLSQLTPSQLIVRLGDTYDGKTGAQIFKLAETKRVERVERRIETIDTKIAEFRARQIDETNQIASTQIILDRIQISDPSYRWEERSGLISLSEPVISFEIINNGNIPIKVFHALAVLSSPGRSVPWVEDTLRYQISGGIEPGETHKFSDRHFLSGWSNPELKDLPGLVLEVTLVGIKDASDQLHSVQRSSSTYSINQIEQLEQQRAEMVIESSAPKFSFGTDD